MAELTCLHVANPYWAQLPTPGRVGLTAHCSLIVSPPPVKRELEDCVEVPESFCPTAFGGTGGAQTAELAMVLYIKVV